jgi:hypothetical protein
MRIWETNYLENSIKEMEEEEYGSGFVLCNVTLLKFYLD